MNIFRYQICLLLWCATYYFSFAQDYSPFPTGKAVWTHKATQFIRFVNPPPTYSFHYCQCGKDTVINDLKYKIISLYSEEPKIRLYNFALLREDQKRIYVRFLGSDCPNSYTEDRLLYDFNQTVGDTLFLFYQNHPFLNCFPYIEPYPFRFLSRDSTKRWGRTRRSQRYDRFFPFDGYLIDTVYEGIGGMHGLLTPIYYIPEDLTIDMYYNTELIDFSEEEERTDSLCKIIRKGFPISRNPNPSTPTFTATVDNQQLILNISDSNLPINGSFHIYNPLGQQMWEGKATFFPLMIDVSTWATGGYVVLFKGKTMLGTTQRIWIVH